MAAISVTYIFTNGTTLDADQVNQNNTDIISGTSDGTKDFSISALTLAGTFTANGNVTLGNASADDVTITGSIAGSIPVKTNASYNFGGSTTGLLSIYLGNSTFTTRLLTAATSTYSLTLPTDGGSVGDILHNDGSASTSWKGYLDATAMSDIVATRGGLKAYSHGTNYNGGFSPTITLSAGGGTLSSVDQSAFIPYQTQSGTWRMRFSITVTLSSASRTTAYLSVAGVTFPSSYFQAIQAYATAGGSGVDYGAAENGSGRLLMKYYNTATTTIHMYAGDVALDSKPTWAY